MFSSKQYRMRIAIQKILTPKFFRITVHSFIDYNVQMTLPFTNIGLGPSAKGILTCPRDTLWKFFLSVVKPIFLPRASTSLSGSTPGLSTKNTGVAGPVSWKETSKGMFFFSTYFVPSFSSTKRLGGRRCQGNVG